MKVRRSSRFAAFVAACVTLASWSVGARLINVQVLSRHGNRAPGDIVRDLCPNDIDNINRYPVRDGGMTGRGMTQMFELGEFIRARYVATGALDAAFSETGAYFRASGATRCMQSATCVGHSLYPKGGAPARYFSDMPTPVPVAMKAIGYDVLLEPRQAGAEGGCKARLHRDVMDWELNGTGTQLLNSSRHLLTAMSRLCGYDIRRAPVDSRGSETVAKAFKDVTDALIADHDESYPLLDGLSMSQLAEFRAFAQTLLQSRLYGTEDRVTYMAGELPYEVLKNVYAGVTAHERGTPNSMKLYSYHAHREMMYAVAHYFNIPIEERVGPSRILPPGSAYFIELHASDDEPTDGQPQTAAAAVSADAPTPMPALANSVSFGSETSSLPYDVATLRSADLTRYHIRVYVWSPCHSSADFPDSPPYDYQPMAEDDTTTSDNGRRNSGGNCPYQLVQLRPRLRADGSRLFAGCRTENCTIAELESILHKRDAATGGGWPALCDYKSYSQLQSTAADSTEEASDLSSTNNRLIVITAMAVLFGLIGWLAVAWQWKTNRYDTQPLAARGEA